MRRSAGLALEVVKTTISQKGFPQDHQHPGITENLDGAGNRAGVFGEISATHIHSLQNMKLQVTDAHTPVKIEPRTTE
jgi:hypothetical protein